MRHIQRFVLIALAIVTGSCVQTAISRETLRPIPEHPARSDKPASLRGTEDAARRLSQAQQIEMIGRIVSVFYRPLMAQARWVDPRPLAHERTRLADSSAAPDHDWAIAIIQASGLRRVCPLDEANEQCRGRDGGVLRFSRAYVVGSGPADSALVYASYTPKSYGVPGEIEFFLTRRDSAWQITSRRSMPAEVAEGSRPSDVVDTRQAAENLLAADRSFAAAAASTDLVTALSSMFLSNVVMQAPGGHVRGREAAVTALAANPDNTGAKAEWTPIGAGTSSDGRDGFTYGYIQVRRANGTVQAGKYVAYWVLRPGGWRVAAYKRVPRGAGDVSLALQPLSIATRAIRPGDSTAVRRYADELSLAEHAFSREAQSIGLGPAFAKYGAPDAVNTGGPNAAEFVRGPEAIARSVAAGVTPETKIEWAPSDVIVASTGDLGVSIGTIRVTAGETREVPFFTIWKRAWPSDPWRYVAE